MKEICFRGKKFDNGEWVIGDLIQLEKEAKYWYILPFGVSAELYETELYKFRENDVMCEVALAKIIPETVGQYTGLTDKNGKKIFEGDIIRYAYLDEYMCYIESLESPEDYEDCNFENLWTVDEVIYGINIGYPAFDLNRHDWEVNGLSNLIETAEYYFEVIGNIYDDNPELLEGKE